MICAICGEEVRVNITFVRYSKVSYAVSDAGGKVYDGKDLEYWEHDDDEDLEEREIKSTVTCGCEECPYMLFDEKVVERQGRYEISKIRRLGYSDAPNSKCSKCNNKAVYCHQWKTHEMSAPGFYYYCDNCLPDELKAGFGTYTEEWEDV